MDEKVFKELKKIVSIIRIPPSYLPRNPIVKEIVEMSQQTPCKYDDVYQTWVNHNRDIEETKRYYRV